MMKDKVVSELQLKSEKCKLDLFAFENVNDPALTSTAKVNVMLEVDRVKANVELWVLEETAQSADIIVGRSFTELPHVAYAKIKDKLILGKRDDELFRPLNEMYTRRKTDTKRYQLYFTAKGIT